MAINLTPEQRAKGKENFHQAVGKLAAQDAQDRKAGMNRRDFMKGMVGAGLVLPVGAAAYFGYATSDGLPAQIKPVKAALIGAGDEGGVLVGEHNPRYVEFVAYCDFRPSNQKRIFRGEQYKKPNSPRRGFNYYYGNSADKKIKRFDTIKELLEDTKLGIEMVVIALPLHLHAAVAIAAMEAGKNVLCEKLMAWNITECKQMIRTADKTGKLLAIGHQRHYSMLYAHAVEVLKSGVLGDINHIRAQWHRNNSKYHDVQVRKERHREYTGGWHFPIPEEDRKALEANIKNLGYKDMKELCQWRLYERTGGGLMAELGSHQLDACSIFLAAFSKKLSNEPEATVRPLAVSAVGGKFFYDDDSEVEDHVFCSYEFPGKEYKKGVKYWTNGKANYDDVVVVTYSSINTNSFEPYGECIMGSQGTMLVELERDVMLFGAAANRTTDVTVKTAGGGKAALEGSASEPGDAAANKQAASLGQASVGTSVPSRGYREEMEHFAYILRNRDEGMEKDKRNLKPRCDGRHAMADAIIALTANVAMQRQQRIEFKDEWFDAKSDEVPDPDRKAGKIIF